MKTNELFISLAKFNFYRHAGYYYIKIMVGKLLKFRIVNSHDT